MNKEKKQSWIKKLYTSPNRRIFSISVTVILFIMIFMGCICYELLQNREEVIQAYEDNQEDYLQLLSYNIRSIQETGEDADVLTFLQEQTVSSGERFFVYTIGSEVLWAKNENTTNTLGKYSEVTEFWKMIRAQDVVVDTVRWTTGQEEYTINVVSDSDSILDRTSTNKHGYYIVIATGLVSVVLLCLLITLLESWNRAEKNLKGTRKELDRRNRKLEKVTSNAGNMELDRDAEDEIAKNIYVHDRYDSSREFYDNNFLRIMLQKSDDEALKPLHYMFIHLDMMDRYYSRQEIFHFMRKIRSRLHQNEVMGEVKKGFFVILLYRLDEQQAKDRADEIYQYCIRKSENAYRSIRYDLVDVGEKKAVDAYDAYTRKQEGENK